MKYLTILYLPVILGLPTLYTPRIIIKSGAAFSQHVLPGVDERIVACLLEYTNPQTNKSEKVGLKLDGIQSFDENDLQKRLSNLGRGICGFRLSKFTTKDPNNFTLFVDYEDSQKTTKSLQLDFSAYCAGLTDKYPVSNKTKYVTISDFETIGCSHQTEKHYACKLYNPKGELIERGPKCDYSIRHVSVDDIGTWKCSLSLMYSMQHFDAFTTLKLKDAAHVDVWYKEEGYYGMIGCQFISPNAYPPDHCLMTNPENVVYSITGKQSATDRYTAIGTNLENITCQIEFTLPLLPSEKGIWKCDIGVTGGFINTDAENTIITLKDQTRYGTLNSSLEITCFVPYSAETCIITSPDGNIYSGGDIETFQLGECNLKIKALEPSHIGTWACRFSRPNTSIDDIMKVEVKTTDVVSGFLEVEVTGGESAELKCKFNSPIYFCTFIDPLGKSYTITPNKKISEIEYVGTGLENGDCGIKINGITGAQAGDWRCVGKNKKGSSNVLEWKTRIIVNSGLIATASSIGIPVGIMTGAVIILVFFIFKRFINTNKIKHRHSDRSNSGLPIAANSIVVNYSS